MLELILLVLFFLSLRFAEFVVLGIVLVYGIWAIYMKTYQPEDWLKIQEAEDRRRARVFEALAEASARAMRSLSSWMSR